MPLIVRSRRAVQFAVKTFYALCQVVCVAGLGVWLGAVLVAGAIAAAIFPMMRELAPTLGSYAQYSGEHWRLAGGEVASRVFLIADTTQFICAVLTAASTGFLAIAQVRRGRSIHMAARVLMTGLTMAVFCYAFFVVAPRMAVALKAYRSAAARGDAAEAEIHQAQFAAMHPTASALMIATAAGVLVTLVLAAWPSRGGPPSYASAGAESLGTAEPAAPAHGAAPRLQPPALLRMPKI
jgi:small-conductance mechanosensitive channel